MKEIRLDETWSSLSNVDGFQCMRESLTGVVMNDLIAVFFDSLGNAFLSLVQSEIDGLNPKKAAR